MAALALFLGPRGEADEENDVKKADEGGIFCEGDGKGEEEDGTLATEKNTEEDGIYIHQRYIRGPIIGEGNFGLVYKSFDTVTKKLVAIKVVSLEGGSGKDDADSVEDIQREINVLAQCRSPYVTRYISSISIRDELWIVMEYLCASVRDVIDWAPLFLKESTISVVLSDICAALEYLHDQGHIHRDIKAANILLAEDGTVKVADFGVAGKLNATMGFRAASLVGTPFWMAPEVILQRQPYNHLADIWSVGITAIEMAVGRPPYSDVHPMKALMMIPRNPPPLLEGAQFSNDLKSFVSVCLQSNPAERPNAHELRSHRFLRRAKPKGRQHLITALKELDRVKEKKDSVSLMYVTNRGAREGVQRNDSEHGYDADGTLRKGGQKGREGDPREEPHARHNSSSQPVVESASGNDDTHAIDRYSTSASLSSKGFDTHDLYYDADSDAYYADSDSEASSCDTVVIHSDGEDGEEAKRTLMDLTQRVLRRFSRHKSDSLSPPNIEQVDFQKDITSATTWTALGSTSKSPPAPPVKETKTQPAESSAADAANHSQTTGKAKRQLTFHHPPAISTGIIPGESSATSNDPIHAPPHHEGNANRNAESKETTVQQDRGSEIPKPPQTTYGTKNDKGKARTHRRVLHSAALAIYTLFYDSMQRNLERVEVASAASKRAALAVQNFITLSTRVLFLILTAYLSFWLSGAKLIYRAFFSISFHFSSLSLSLADLAILFSIRRMILLSGSALKVVDTFMRVAIANLAAGLAIYNGVTRMSLDSITRIMRHFTFSERPKEDAD